MGMTDESRIAAPEPGAGLSPYLWAPGLVIIVALMLWYFTR
jgi:hypothetical protein